MKKAKLWEEYRKLRVTTVLTTIVMAALSYVWLDHELSIVALIILGGIGTLYTINDMEKRERQELRKRRMERFRMMTKEELLASADRKGA